MWRPLVAVLAVASLGAGAAFAEEEAESQRLEERADLLRDPEVLLVDNASPVEESHVQGQLDFASRPETGEPGTVTRLEARLGLPWNLELGAGGQWESGGAEEPSSVEGAARLLAGVVSEHGYLPALSLEGTVVTPQGDAGVGAEARVLASKSLGRGQVHANAAYRAQVRESDEYLLSLGADGAVGDSWLVRGDAYFLRTLGASPEDTLGLDVGAGFLVSEHWVVTGVVGLNSHESDVAPRVVLGLMGQL
jgi:hypothetical protein